MNALYYSTLSCMQPVQYNDHVMLSLTSNVPLHITVLRVFTSFAKYIKLLHKWLSGGEMFSCARLHGHGTFLFLIVCTCNDVWSSWHSTGLSSIATF